MNDLVNPGAEPVPFVEGIDITYNDFIENTDVAESEIVNFFKGTKVFITGASGFMGQVLLEKLIRTCTDIEMIYVLLRPKKGKSMEERFKAQFDGKLFDVVRKKRPGFARKIRTIAGDCSLPNLGLSEDDIDVVRSCNIIFHAAATVRFDEKLRSATAINVSATMDLLKIARTMEDLKSFVYISTAYSNPQFKIIEEKFYDIVIDYKKLMSVVDSLEDVVLEKCTPALIEPWPNSYAFTKAAAESGVRDLSKGLPVAMIRPSIVISTANEPIVGWINNVYGPTGVVAGAGLGLLRTLHADPDKVADVIPVDMVINATIAVAYETGRTREERVNKQVESVEEDPRVYNYVSRVDNPLTWGEFMAFNARATCIPSVHGVWAYAFTLNKHYRLHMLYVIFLHLLPALLVDITMRIIGKKPFLWEAYRKIHKFSSVIAYFSTQDWQFVNGNTKALLDRLNSTDKQLFDFDMKKLNWDSYFLSYMRGLRIYLVNDPMETLPEARKKYRRLYAVHCTVKYGFRLLLVYLIYSFLAPYLSHLSWIRNACEYYQFACETCLPCGCTRSSLSL